MVPGESPAPLAVTVDHLPQWPVNLEGDRPAQALARVCPRIRHGLDCRVQKLTGRLAACGILDGMTTARQGRDLPAPRRQFMASKVPVITAYFWIIKVLTTAMGEATSDFLNHRFDPYLVVPLGGVAFCIVVGIQLSVRRYMTWIYWSAVVMVAIFGTMMADSIHIALHVPYALSTAGFAARSP